MIFIIEIYFFIYLDLILFLNMKKKLYICFLIFLCDLFRCNFDSDFNIFIKNLFR